MIVKTEVPRLPFSFVAEWVTIWFSNRLPGKLVFTAAFLASLNLVAAPSPESAMDQWVKTRLLEAQAQREWQKEQQQMNALIDLYQQGIQRMRTEYDSLEKDHKLELEQISKIETELHDIQSSESALLEKLTVWESQAQEFLTLLPERVRIDMEQRPEYISRISSSSILDRVEQLCNQLQVLNEFQRETTLSSEIRTLEDGKRVEFEVVYLGFSIAYYRSLSSGVSGYGIPYGNQWVWTEDASVAVPLEQAIAILEHSTAPAFVELPVPAVNKEVAR